MELPPFVVLGCSRLLASAGWDHRMLCKHNNLSDEAEFIGESVWIHTANVAFFKLSAFDVRVSSVSLEKFQDLVSGLLSLVSTVWTLVISSVDVLLEFPA